MHLRKLGSLKIIPENFHRNFLFKKGTVFIQYFTWQKIISSMNKNHKILHKNTLLIVFSYFFMLEYLTIYRLFFN